MSTTAPEYLTSLRDGLADAVQQWVDQSASAWDQWSQAWSPVVEAAGLGMPGGPGAAPGRRDRGMSRHRPGAGHHHERSGHGCDHGCEHGCDHGRSGRDCGCGRSGPTSRHDHGHDHDHGHGHDHDHDHDHDHGHGHDHDHGRGQVGCGCQDSSCCRDACDCCVPEADVVVRARVGEVRVVPFRLHNPWRRAREVSLEVGPWHGCDGEDLQVRAVLEEEKLVLAPCEDRVVRLLVSVRSAGDDGSASSRSDSAEAGDARPDDARAKPAKPAKDAGASAAAREPVDVVVGTRGRGQDVESCASAYADVRFEGCARAQRVAVVVLPAECDPVEVGCDCGCCC